MASAVISEVGGDLGCFVNELRSELGSMRRELSALVKENLQLKEEIYKLQRGEVSFSADGDGIKSTLRCANGDDWQSVKGKGKRRNTIVNPLSTDP